MTTLPLGTLVRYQPHHPGTAYHPALWRIVGVQTRQDAYQAVPFVTYTLRCEEVLPGALAMDWCVRAERVTAVGVPPGC